MMFKMYLGLGYYVLSFSFPLYHSLSETASASKIVEFKTNESKSAMGSSLPEKNHQVEETSHPGV